jgi:hypothetical protein
MMDKLLYLNESGLTLIDVNSAMQHKLSETKFSWSDWDRIETAVGGLPSEKSVAVILDFVDDSHQMHWVAKLFPWEKQAYEKRLEEKTRSEGAMLVRLSWFAHYRQTDEGRNEQALMISSVFSNTQLETLFNLFEEAQISVKAIYSYSFLLESYFLTKLAPALSLTKKDLSRPLMLVFRESRVHFRQIFFNFGRLNISRHIELDDELESDHAINSALIHETQIAVKYLYNQKLIPLNSEVSFIYINSHGHDEGEVATEYLEKVALTNWKPEAFFVVASDLYTITNTRRWDESLYNTLDFLTAFLHKSNLQTFYKNHFVDKILLFSRLQKWLLGLSVLFFLSASYYLLTLGVDDYMLSHKRQLMEVKIQQLNEEKSRLQRSVDLQYDAEDIKASVNFSESLLKLKLRGIAGFDMAALSQVLSRHNHVALSSVAWQKLDTFDSSSISVTLKGWVYPFHDAYEMPVKWVDDLVQDFRSQPNVESVTLTKEPLDRSLKKSLVISSASDEAINALPFEVKLVIGGVK